MNLRAEFPDRYVLEVSDPHFELQGYAADGHCQLRPQGPDCVLDHRWDPDRGLVAQLVRGWFEVTWKGSRLEGVRQDSPRGYTLLCDSEMLAHDFVMAVCRWASEPKDELLVYENGAWSKSAQLFTAVQDTTFENLVLERDLKSQIRTDFDRFFASRALYEERRVPWKRGVLFIGPPGNGKTHAVKALVNHLGKPCLYVKSLTPADRNESLTASVARVFAKAREIRPCLLVLEDLDSLVAPENKAYFLNEVDGFEQNHGLVILASTNHPERLDPAILDRPSRFDRKYYFPLPGSPERRVYLAMCSAGLDSAIQLTPSQVDELAGLTEGFSFAYLKELYLATMMAWLHGGEARSLRDVMAEQCQVLREQMAAIEPPLLRD